MFVDPIVVGSNSYRNCLMIAVVCELNCVLYVFKWIMSMWESIATKRKVKLMQREEHRIFLGKFSNNEIDISC